jgi:hypothetical protein
MKTASQAAVLAALAASIFSADAIPIEYNPYTTSASSTTLSHDNPAFGAVSSTTTSSSSSSSSTAAYEERSYEIPDVPDYVPGSGSTSTTTITTSGSNGSTTTTTTTTSSANTTGSLGSSTYTSTTTSSTTTSGTPTADITFGESSMGNDSVLAPVTRKLDASSSTDIQKLETFFGSSMEVNVNNLATSAAYYVMPWPSSYWPIYLDGINYAWDSSSSLGPAAKYATAFGLDVDDFTKSVSESTGILSQSTSTSCSSNWDCYYSDSSSVCAKRTGEYTGYCIPTWYGICHAWTPASILEPEPNCAIDYNGVTFQPMDIKALLSEVYDGANVGTVFTGARYSGSDSTAETDQYGRYTDSSRRDLGPGFMHIAMTNILSRFNSSFILDVEGGSQVWNQPIYSYEVVTQTEMTPTEGAQQYFGKQSYPFNDAAESLMYTETTIVWMVETLEDGGLVKNGEAAQYTSSDTYKYLLELDSSGNILGGEWVGDSMSDHPDFLWFPTSKPDTSTVTEVGLSYANVLTLLDMATSC